MIDALITGKLFKAAEARTSKNGNTFVTATMTVADADQQRQFVKLICFREPVCDQLLALATGDSLAVSGPLKVSTYTAKDGSTRISYDLTVETCMTMYQLSKKRAKSQASQDDQPDRAPAPAGQDDGFIDAGQPLDF